MINANELRIGNWVWGVDPSMGPEVRQFKVDSLEDDRINVWRVEGFDTESAKGVEGIALTPEILKACGFNNGKLGQFEFINNADLIINGHEHDYNGIYIGKMESLHQLQNLYFALTGQELEYKP